MLQRLKFTLTSEDPICATLFALNAARRGDAIVYICDRNRVADLIRPGNILAEVEREIVVGVSPAEFADQYVSFAIPVQKARKILAEMGFELPVGVSDNGILDQLLRDTARLGRRHIEQFNDLAITRGGS